MNIIEKSESIRAGLRKGFQNGTSKLAQRRCYGYNTGPDGELIIKEPLIKTSALIVDVIK